MNDELNIINDRTTEMNTSGWLASKLMSEFDLYRNQNDFSDSLYYLAKKVMIVGNGSTGSHLALNLARLGVGQFILIDGDIVNPHNCTSSAFNIRQIYETYYTDKAFDKFVAEYNRFKYGRLGKNLPYKSKILAEMIEHQVGVVTNVDYATAFLKPIHVQNMNRGDQQSFISTMKRGGQITNAFDQTKDMNEFKFGGIDHFNKILSEYTSVLNKFSDKQYSIPSELLISHNEEVGFFRAFPQIVEGQRVNYVLANYDMDSSTTLRPFDLAESFDLEDHFNYGLDIIFLCTDNFLARLSTVNILRNRLRWYTYYGFDRQEKSSLVLRKEYSLRFGTIFKSIDQAIVC